MRKNTAVMVVTLDVEVLCTSSSYTVCSSPRTPASCRENGDSNAIQNKSLQPSTFHRSVYVAVQHRPLACQLIRLGASCVHPGASLSSAVAKKQTKEPQQNKTLICQRLYILSFTRDWCNLARLILSSAIASNSKLKLGPGTLIISLLVQLSSRNPPFFPINITALLEIGQIVIGKEDD